MFFKIFKYCCPSLYLHLSWVDILSVEDFGDLHSCTCLLECDIDYATRIEEILLHLTERIAHRFHRSHFCILSCEVESEAPIASFHMSREYSSDFR